MLISASTGSAFCAGGKDKIRDAVLTEQHRYFDLILAKRYDDLDAILAPEYLGTYRGGVIGKTKESSDLRNFPLAAYKISDERSLVVDKKTVIMSFHLHVKVTVDSKDLFEDDNICCVWHKTGNKWLLVSQAAVKTDTN